MTAIESICQELGVDIKDVELIKGGIASFRRLTESSGISFAPGGETIYSYSDIYWIDIDKIKNPLDLRTRKNCFIRMNGEHCSLYEFNQYVFMRNTKLGQAL
jgi:hypothetical protein